MTVDEKYTQLGSMRLAANISVFLRTEDIKNLDADAAVVSTGASAKIPYISGMRRSNAATACFHIFELSPTLPSNSDVFQMPLWKKNLLNRQNYIVPLRKSTPGRLPMDDD